MRAGYHPSPKNEASKKAGLKEQGFYHSPAWRRLRKLALQRDRYQCQLRLSKKCTGVATEVHHMRPVADAPELALDLDNLTSCCWWCHEETKHQPAQAETKRGVARVIRITDGTDEL